MKCGFVRGNLSAYIDQELSSKHSDFIKLHLTVCSKCHEEFKKMNEAWDILGEWKGIEPDPSYLARFWTELSHYSTGQEKFIKIWEAAINPKRLIPGLIVIVFLIFAGFLTHRHIKLTKTVEEHLKNLTIEEIDFADHLGLLKDLETIRLMDFLNELKIIEKM